MHTNMNLYSYIWMEDKENLKAITYIDYLGTIREDETE